MLAAEQGRLWVSWGQRAEDKGQGGGARPVSLLSHRAGEEAGLPTAGGAGAATTDPARAWGLPPPLAGQVSKMQQAPPI